MTVTLVSTSGDGGSLFECVYGVIISDIQTKANLMTENYRKDNTGKVIREPLALHTYSLLMLMKLEGIKVH
jgi:hypothetical protein